MFTDTKSIENGFAHLRVTERILQIIYKPGTVLDLQKALRITEDRLLLQKEKTRPAFVDFREVIHVERAARHYFAHEGSILLQALAVWCSSPQTEAIVNFYIRANVPAVPTRVFTDKYTALNYLKPFP